VPTRYAARTPKAASADQAVIRLDQEDRLPADASEGRAGRTNSAIKALNLAGSSTNGSCPESSNQTSFFEGAINASMYATLVSAGTQ
jgi:hypothetical protein